MFAAERAANINHQKFASFRPLSEKKQDEILCVLSVSDEQSEWTVKIHSE
jgi:hypothetical protein